MVLKIPVKRRPPGEFPLNFRTRIGHFATDQGNDPRTVEIDSAAQRAFGCEALFER
jgi:hypothetical protein